MSDRKRPHSPVDDPDQSNKRQEVDVASESEDDQRPTPKPNGSTPTTFEYKGHNYTLFQDWECGYLDVLLFTQKHSISRLHDAEYFILDDPNPSTPSAGYRKEDFICMPAYDPSQGKLRHVVIDCSYVLCEGGTMEMSHMVVLNMINGEEIINSYIWPRTPVIDWDHDSNDKTVTEQVLVNASLDGGVLLGWEATRKKLAQHVDAETVFVGAQLDVDLYALRISHKNIFDYKIVDEDSTKNREAMRGTPHEQYPGDEYEGFEINTEADGSVDYYKWALIAREISINCLKRPWVAYQLYR
ncbi:RNA exonuclease 1 [Apiospora sp. TS-2023a]